MMEEEYTECGEEMRRWKERLTLALLMILELRANVWIGTYKRSDLVI